jgi:beta-fructofuranosidase
VTHPDPSFPTLHGRPDHGWINDPNGLAVIDGRYHVFFQYNPDAPVHTNIHWGHASSADLVRWREEPIALAPRVGGPDEQGCWSGCLVDDNGTPTAVYTAVGAAGPHSGGVVLATSDRSAVQWTQRESVLEHSDEPHDIDVRDPYLFSFGGRRYAVQGGGRAGGTPRILLYACDDLHDWTFLGDLLTPDDPVAAAYGAVDVWECPNLFELDGSWVLLASPLTLGGDGPVMGEVFALVGGLEPEGDGLRFRPETASRVDSGASFYAPQVLVHGDRRLLWAWTRDLGRPPEEIAAAGWTGALTFARELRLDGGVLRAEPAAELAGLRRERMEPIDGILSEASFELEGDSAGFRLVLEGDGTAEVVVDIEGDQARGIRILVDGSIVEVFADGATQRTLRAYPGPRSRWRVESGSELRIWRLGLPGH